MTDTTTATRTKRILLLALAFSAVGNVAAWVLSIHTSQAHTDVPLYSFIIEGSFSAIPLAAIALLLIVRRPDHRVTWVFVAIAVAGGMQGFAGSYAHEALLGQGGGLPAGEVALLASSAAQSSFVILSIVMVNVFPTGDAATRRWRPLTWLALLALVAAGLQPFLDEFPWAGDPEFPWFETVRGSLHGRVPVIVASILGAVGTATTSILLLGTPIHLLVRFRRAAGPERAQMKWLVYAFLTTLTVLLLPWNHPALAWTGVQQLPGWLLWAIGPLAIWAAIATAVLRYRLYDIDRVVSRTLSYALLTGVLVGVYALGVLGVEALLPGEPGDLFVAASTLTVAALFRPLRTRIQSLVDRRFNRARYDATRTVDGFAARLRDQVDVDVLGAGLRSTVGETFAPRVVTLWTRAST